MNFTTYQQEARRTANASSPYPLLFNWALGLCGETGEVVEIIKKATFHGYPLDVEKLEDELGDVLWYVTNLADSLGLDLGKIAEKNVAKLRKRYPSGFQKRRGMNAQDSKS